MSLTPTRSYSRGFSLLMMVVAVSASTTLAFNVVAPGTRASPAAQSDPPMVVSVKMWADVNGTYGVQAIPKAAVSPDTNYNWIENTLPVTAGSSLTLTAPPSLYGLKWAFWQEQGTNLIVHSRTITINATSTWWENYYA